jgi:hypothetical protein
MKKALFAFALLMLCASFLNVQGKTQQPAATTSADTIADYEKSCQTETLHTPAYEYCREFAILLTDSNNLDALRHLENLTAEGAQLVNAYSIYKSSGADLLNSLVSATQKAATNNQLP